jgi:predicted  nucleic acid-binding Zn-ribbon protein
MRKLFIFATILFTSACSTVKDSDDYRKLAAEKATLEEEIRIRDEELEEITSSMNKIDSNLMAISKYVVVMDGIKLSDMVQQKGEIDLMVNEIGTYLQENNQMVEDLDKKVKESTRINAGMKKMIEQQKKMVEEKERQINALLSQVDSLKQALAQTVSSKNAEISTIHEQLQEKQAEISTQQKDLEEKEATLNTAYFVFGPKQDLVDKGIIQVDGGLLNGKITVTNKFEKEKFKAVNILNVAEVDMGITKRQKAVTSHPVDSYYFVKTDGRTFLKIVDTKKFWSISKFLVIVTD